MTGSSMVPQDILGEMAHAYKAIDRAIFECYDDPAEFRKWSKIALLRLRAVEMMGWTE